MVGIPDTAYASSLESKIESCLSEKIDGGKLTRHETIAFLVHDYVAGKTIVSRNAHVPMQTASMVKPFVALAYFHGVRNGLYRYTAVNMKRLMWMLRDSCNHSTNLIMRSLGGPDEVHHLLIDNYPHIFKQMSIVEYIPKGGKTYKNMASADDYNRFLQELWAQRLPYSDKILRYMHLPNNDRIYKRVKSIPKETLVYDKSGTTGMLCGNMGLLSAKGKDGKRYPYNIIGIIQRDRRADGVCWQYSRGWIIRELSGIVYEHMKKKYGLI